MQHVHTTALLALWPLLIQRALALQDRAESEASENEAESASGEVIGVEGTDSQHAEDHDQHVRQHKQDGADGAHGSGSRLCKFDPADAQFWPDLGPVASQFLPRHSAARLFLDPNAQLFTGHAAVLLSGKLGQVNRADGKPAGELGDAPAGEAV